MPIRITAKKDGFRRCGVTHPAQPTEHPDDAFSKKDLEILKAEPMLVVEVLPEQKEKKDTPGK
ncbi:MAG: HI1506-related protein [Pseudomonadota bacterium]